MRTCTVDQCSKKWFAAGYCSAHYGRQHHYGRLELLPKKTDNERFWAKVEKSGSCWEWRGERYKNGYGIFLIGFKPKVRMVAHRWLWQKTFGPITPPLQVDHICRNRACVRLDHLRLLTPRDNLLCGIGPSAVNARKTHCIRGHEFTPENTHRWGPEKRFRQCKTCNRLRARGEFHGAPLAATAAEAPGGP